MLLDNVPCRDTFHVEEMWIMSGSVDENNRL